MAQLKFETALSRLEETVSVLEKGDLPLEEALKVFEEGIRLSKTCMKTLSEAEKKIEILIAGKDGKKKARPFTLAEEKSTGKDVSNESV